MVKSVKAKLETELKKYAPVASTLTDDCTSIFSSFGEISDYLLHKLLSSTHKIVFFVTDRYVENSTKSLERQERSSTGTIHYEVRRDQTKQNQFDKFLRSWKQNEFSKILARRLEE